MGHQIIRQTVAVLIAILIVDMKFHAYSGRDLHSAKAVMVSAKNEGKTLEQALDELEAFMEPKEAMKTVPIPENKKKEVCPECGNPAYIKRRGIDVPDNHPDQEWMRDCIRCGFSTYIGKE
jgi:hypothetical protein